MFNSQLHLGKTRVDCNPIYGSSKGILKGLDPIDIPDAEPPNIERDIEDLHLPGFDIEAAVGKN